MRRKITLVIGPGKKTRGGITSVIKAFEKTEFWKDQHCCWIETYIDRNFLYKIFYFLKSIPIFFIRLPITKLVHIHFSEPTSALRKYFFFVIAKFLKKRIIVHFHSFSPYTTLYGPQKNLYRRMFEGANAIIALSPFWKTEIAKLITNPSKIEVIYNPCPAIQNPTKIKKQKIILYAGTLTKRKGYADLIEAFSLVPKKHRDWKVVFAGNGEIEEAKSIAKKLNTDSQIVFKGWVSGNEKEHLFSISSIFCLPSYAEGLPMAVLDAWAYGLSVIATPVGGLKDILIHGKNSMIFEPGDIHGLSNNLQQLIANRQLLKNLSEASVKLSQGPFNIQNISEQVDNLYTKVCKK
ncbi:glycosyltransferase family 4 protein [bacterium]|nr:glycosyltransferase family 4 protein [bacterium]